MVKPEWQPGDDHYQNWGQIDLNDIKSYISLEQKCTDQTWVVTWNSFTEDQINSYNYWNFTDRMDKKIFSGRNMGSNTRPLKFSWASAIYRKQFQAYQKSEQQFLMQLVHRWVQTEAIQILISILNFLSHCRSKQYLIRCIHLKLSDWHN